MGAEEDKMRVCDQASDTEDKGDSGHHTGPVSQSSSPGDQGTAAFTPESYGLVRGRAPREGQGPGPPGPGSRGSP